MSTYIIFGACELIALFFIVRLWRRRPLRVVSSVIWSLVLLVPVLGLLLYVFLSEDPSPHGDNPSGNYFDGGSDGGHGH